MAVECFHGGSTRFLHPRPLTHFGTMAAAASAPGCKGAVMEFRLHMENPLEVQDAPGGGDLWYWMDTAFRNGDISSQDFQDWEQRPTPEGAVALLKAAGYDGITYVNSFEDPGSRSWVIFDTAQATWIRDLDTSSIASLPACY
jgi:hypothetical protein